MILLKRENWWIWLLLLIFTSGSSTYALAALLNCYDKDAWYANYEYWLIGGLCLILPALIMVYVLYIEMLCKCAAKLNVSGKEIYMSPYTWILCLIVPFVGWVLLFVMIFYLQIWTLINLSHGEGDNYANKK